MSLWKNEAYVSLWCLGRVQPHKAELMNSWLWFFDTRFCPIARSRTFTSSQTRGCSGLEPRHEANQLCSRKSGSKPLLSWSVRGSVGVRATEGYCKRALYHSMYLCVSSKVPQMRSFLRNPSPGVQSAMFSCAHLPLITRDCMWSISDTCVALVFSRVFTCIYSVGHHSNHFQRNAFGSHLDPGYDGRNQKLKLALTYMKNV